MRSTTAVTALGLVKWAGAATTLPEGDPFAAVDPQKWVNPDDMTWDDFVSPPGTNWSDPSVKGSERNFNIALVTLDYEDRPFVVTQPVGSTIYSNPQPAAAGLARDDVPAFYRDLLNHAGNDLNGGHTLHEYWMSDSHGKFGVDLTVFGVYKMPALAYQYGIDDEGINAGACPAGKKCSLDLRTDGLGAWRADVGDEVADSFELVFILSAGQDESATWQEFGEMKFDSEEDIPDEFGPPRGDGNETSANWSPTRYVPWSSWAAASNIWPNAGGGSSTQAESSGMGVYAHELSHLLSIGDNYNNPYSVPRQRDYTGSWSMMSRGSFNGPGGPHSRWQIPALQGASMGSLHTVRDKYQLGLMPNASLLRVGADALAKSGIVTARLTARAVVSDLLGLRVEMGEDRGPECDPETSPFCDGGGYNNYEMEVVDRMGPDSFQPDHGVMISKTKDIDDQPFQWTIDANPDDVALVDFIRPNGTEAMVTVGDYRQLADALFHAGTRSGSEFEFVDENNGLHLYVLEYARDEQGVLSYTVGVRSLAGSGASDFGAQLGEGKPVEGSTTTPTKEGVFCVFDLTNNGTYVAGGEHPSDVSAHVGSDIYRLEAVTESEGWRVALPYALAEAGMGKTVGVYVAIGAEGTAADTGIVKLTATSESDGDVKAEAECSVKKE